MKQTIIIILVLISILSFGQNDDKLKDKPKTLEETFQHLNQKTYKKRVCTYHKKQILKHFDRINVKYSFSALANER